MPDFLMLRQTIKKVMCMFVVFVYLLHFSCKISQNFQMNK